MVAKNKLRTSKHMFAEVVLLTEFVTKTLEQGLATEIIIQDDRSGSTGRINVYVTLPRVG